MPPGIIDEPPATPVKGGEIPPDSTDWRPAYIAALAETGMHTRAATAAGISHCQAYKHRQSDIEFAAKCEEAMKVASESLEAEARRRAQEGVRRLKFYQGEAILDPETGRPYVEHEYSDALTMFLLKGERPDKYKDRSEVDMGARINMDEPILVKLPPIMMAPPANLQKTEEPVP
jgi:hypothetical protein